MLKFMKRMIYGKNLKDVLNATKVVRINGVRFVIKKISVLDYASGAKVLLQYHDTYKPNIKDQKIDSNVEKKIKEHYAHVLVAGTLSPKLVHSEKEQGIHVEQMFIDFDLVEKLYSEIMSFTYGKKKVQTLNSQKSD